MGTSAVTLADEGVSQSEVIVHFVTALSVTEPCDIVETIQFQDELLECPDLVRRKEGLEVCNNNFFLSLSVHAIGNGRL